MHLTRFEYNINKQPSITRQYAAKQEVIKVIPSKSINPRYAPTEFFGLRKICLAFLTEYPEIDFSYTSILRACELIEDIDTAYIPKQQLRRTIKEANECIKHLRVNLKTTTSQPENKKQLVAESHKQLKLCLHKTMTTLRMVLKISSTTRLPADLQVVYAVYELKNVGSRICNRLDSNYLYNESTDKEVAHLMVDVGIDSIVSNYLVNTQNVVTGADGDHEREIKHTDDLIDILEYMMVLFNKIDDGYSLYCFKYLPSHTTELLTQNLTRTHDAA